MPKTDLLGNPNPKPRYRNGTEVPDDAIWESNRAQYSDRQYPKRDGNAFIVDAGDVNEARQAIMTPNNVIHELGHSFNSFAGLGISTGNMLALADQQGYTSREGMGYPDPDKFLNRDLYWQITSGSDDDWWANPDNEPEYLGHDIIEAGGTGYRTNNFVDILRHSSTVHDVNEVVADGFLNWVVDLTTGNWLYNPQNDEINYLLRGFTHDVTGNNWRDFMNENMSLWMRNSIVHNMDPDTKTELFQEYDLLPDTIPVEYNGNAWNIRSGPHMDYNVISNTHHSDFAEELEIVAQKVLNPDDPEKREVWIQIYFNGKLGWISGDAFIQHDGQNALDGIDIPLENNIVNKIFDPTMTIDQTPWWRDIISPTFENHSSNTNVL